MSQIQDEHSDVPTEVIDEDEPMPQPQPEPPKWHIDTLTVDPRVLSHLVAATRTRYEMGGLLIGQRDEAHHAVDILGYVFPKQSRQTSVFCAFDMRWVSLMKGALIECELHPQVTLIAWIHTHPRLSVFLSGTDVRTIDVLQQYNPLTLAVVLDPYNNDIGAFHFERHQRDTRIVYAPIRVEASLIRCLRLLKRTPQVKSMSKSWFMTEIRPSEAPQTVQDASAIERTTAARRFR